MKHFQDELDEFMRLISGLNTLEIIPKVYEMIQNQLALMKSIPLTEQAQKKLEEGRKAAFDNLLSKMNEKYSEYLTTLGDLTNLAPESMLRLIDYHLMWNEINTLNIGKFDPSPELEAVRDSLPHGFDDLRNNEELQHNHSELLDRLNDYDQRSKEHNIGNDNI